MTPTYPIPQMSSVASPRWWGAGTGVSRAEVVHGLPRGVHLDLAGGRRHFGVSSPRDGIRHEVLRNMPHAATDISLAGGKQHFQHGSSPARCTSIPSIMRSPEQQAAATPREHQVATGSLSSRKHYSPEQIRSRSTSLEPRQCETVRDLQLLEHRQALGRSTSFRGPSRGKSPSVVRRKSEGGRARSCSPAAEGIEGTPTGEPAQQEQVSLGRSLSPRRSLGSPRRSQASGIDQQQQQSGFRTPGRPGKISTSSSPRRSGSSVVVNASPWRGGGGSLVARPQSPGVGGASSPSRNRRTSGGLSPRSTIGTCSPARKPSTPCVSSTAEQGSPLAVDDISVAVDDIIRQKMDAAWAVVCQRFNIPFDVKSQPSQSSKAHPASPRKQRASLGGGERQRRPAAAPGGAASPSSPSSDYALQRAMKAVHSHSFAKVNSPVKELGGSSPRQRHVGSTDHLNYCTPPVPPRHRRHSEPMQCKSAAGSKAQFFISDASVQK